MSQWLRNLILLDQYTQEASEMTRGGLKRTPVFDFSDSSVVDDTDLARLEREASSGIDTLVRKNKAAADRAKQQAGRKGKKRDVGLR